MSEQHEDGEGRPDAGSEGEASPTFGPELERLIAEGKVSRPKRRGLPEPLELPGDPNAISRALYELRDDR